MRFSKEDFANNMGMLMAGVLGMQGPLETMGQTWANDDPNKDLVKVIPAHRQFRLLGYLTVSLKIVNSYSNMFKNDPALAHKGLNELKNMVHHLQVAESTIDDIKNKDEEDGWALNYAQETIRGMIKAIQSDFYLQDSEGIFAKCALFDPTSKGKKLLSEEKYRELIKNTINEHPSTAKFKCEKKDVNLTFDIYSPDELRAMDIGKRFRLEMEAERKRYKLQSESSKFKSPIEEEFDRYMMMHNVPEDVDVLNWWRDHQIDLPILSEMAKEYIAIPFVSAAEKRRNDRKDKPHLTYWENSTKEIPQVEDLMFIQANYGKVKLEFNKWNCMSLVSKTNND